jgi:hypothetical protein
MHTPGPCFICDSVNWASGKGEASEIETVRGNGTFVLAPEDPAVRARDIEDPRTLEPGQA